MAKREYVEANKRWLEEKAKEEGVMALPRGIYYKVLKQGDPKGAQPSRRSIVTAHYTGWTINGKKIVAMQQMHVGDQWELYIPAEMGYGKFSQPGIPGGSTLIFEVELLGVG